MNAITGQQRQMMTFLARFQDQHGYAPTMREITEGLGISSTSVAAYRLDRLRDQGLIEREPGKSRALRIVGDAGAWLSVAADGAAVAAS